MTTSYHKKTNSHCTLVEKGLCLHSMVENLPGFAYSYKLFPDGKQKFLYASDNVIDIYGIDAKTIQEDLQQLRLSFHAQDLEVFQKNILISAQTLQPFHAEFRYFHPTKGLIWLETRSHPSAQEDGSIIWHGITLDITQRKQTEETLRQTATHLSSLLNTMPDLVWMKDLEGKYLICNHAFEHFFGAHASRIIGKTDYAFVDKELADFFRQKDLEAINKGGVNTNEEEITYKATGERGLLETRKAPVYDDNGTLVGVLGIAKDITLKKELQEKLLQKELRLKEAHRIAKLGTWELSFPELRFHLSQELYGILNIDKTEQIFSYDHFLNIIHPEDKRRVDTLVYEAICTKNPYDTVHRLLMRDENIKYVYEHAETLYNGNGEPIKMIGIMQDITEQKQAEHRIEFLAHHDTLTGLPNRSLAIDRMEQAIVYAKKNKTKVALLYVDMDGFKTINDSLGHNTGDRMIQAIAKRLQESLKETDTISRQGGDEFLIILTDIGNTDNISAIATRLVAKLNQPVTLDTRSLTSTVSIGISLYPDDGGDFEALLQKADTAMYKAKERGGNGYCFFKDQMNKEITEHMSLLHDLKQALLHGELELFFQPQINLETYQLSGVEALLRWKHPTKGMIPPMQFIPIAESSGLIVQIGEWVIQEACKKAALWCTKGLHCHIAVNISALQFQRGNLEETIVSALKLSNLEAKYLELELTESVLIQDAEQTLQSIQKLKSLGLKLAIDDFGTGYSSLSYLKRFAVDKLKIDKSFIQDIAGGNENTAIVQAIIQIAKSLGLKTIAEGAETKEVVELLKTNGCDEVQGFYYAKPMPYDEFIAYCASLCERKNVQ